MSKVPEQCRIHGNMYGVPTSNAVRSNRSREKRRRVGITDEMARGSKADVMMKLREKTRKETEELLGIEINRENEQERAVVRDIRDLILDPIKMQDQPPMILIRSVEV